MTATRSPAVPLARAGDGQDLAGRAPAASPPVAGFPVPYWRELLTARWQDEVMQVTELSLAYCESAGAGTGGSQAARRRLRRLERQTTAARRALVEIEEALGRLSAGLYGRCEQCGAGIPAGRLVRQPEVRYCPGCSPSAAATAAVTTSPAFRNLVTLLLASALARTRRRLARRGGGRGGTARDGGARGRLPRAARGGGSKS